MRNSGISIHALLAESDVVNRAQKLVRKFLSTLSLRRATWIANSQMPGIQFLSTLSLRRATAHNGHTKCPPWISIHALLAESDWVPQNAIAKYTYFYPRSPCGERPSRVAITSVAKYFYPRSPCGERLAQRTVKSAFTIFLSTLSLRRATGFGVGSWRLAIFLSTLSLRRATLGNVVAALPMSFLSTLSLRRATLVASVLEAGGSRYFYPRSPCGERPTKSDQGASTHQISIHALLAESDYLATW